MKCPRQLRGPLAPWLRISLWTFAAAGLHSAAITRADAPPAPTSVSLPLDDRSGQIFISAKVNDSEPLRLLVDSGFAMTMLHRRQVEALALQNAGSVTIIGIAGRENAGMFRGAKFDFQGLIYAPRRIASLPSEGQRRRRDPQGTLGSGFFKRFVVEINHQTKTLHLHEPSTFKYSGPGEIIPLHFDKDTPIIEARLSAPGRDPVKMRLEIDTGCSGGLCLGAPFVKDNPWLQSTGQWESSARRGVGGGVSTLEGRLPPIYLGQLKFEGASGNLFLDASPVDDGLAGHIGWEALQQFKVILDYSRSRLILEPSK